jgi:hypothetical protein
MSPIETSVSEEDPHSALIFALAAERLAAYYEYNTWLTIAQGATLAASEPLQPLRYRHLEYRQSAFGGRQRWRGVI